MSRLLGLVVVWVLLVAGAALAEGGWYRVAPEDEFYSLTMPGQPQEELDEHSSFMGTVEARSFRYDQRGAMFMASSTELPRWVAMMTPSGVLLRSGRNNFLEQGQAEQRVWEDIERAGISGKRLEYEKARDGVSWQGRAEFYTFNRRIYVFFAEVEATPPERRTAIDRFFAALELRPG